MWEVLTGLEQKPAKGRRCQDIACNDRLPAAILHSRQQGLPASAGSPCCCI
ncbi:hypothetical protein [Prevotella multiformis]|uniref:hypothetical protein n=1 Tax=Prevotella multiformis TaxID=282402 RepID=UPI0028DBCB00|nr:hypothetical protein [Prevotella multiformis]